MRPSPFLEDPRDLLRRHVAQAVDSPLEEVRAFHLTAAEHQAEIARGSGLSPRARADAVDRRQRGARVAIVAGMLCLLVAVLGMLALGAALLRS